MCKSVRQTAQAPTRIKTSPGPGSGRGNIRCPERLALGIKDHRFHRGIEDLISKNANCKLENDASWRGWSKRGILAQNLHS